jgi:hypothetical protein
LVLTVACQSRLFRIGPHAAEQASFLLARSARGAEALDPRFVYILRGQGKLFIWSDPSCAARPAALAAAATFLAQMRLVGAAPASEPLAVTAHSEPAEFWAALMSDPTLAAEGGDRLAIRELAELHADAELLVTGGVPAVPQTPRLSLAEGAKAGDASPDGGGSGSHAVLYAFPSMEHITMFDPDDLDEEAAFALVSATGRVFVWVGEVAEEAAMDEDALCGEVVAALRAVEGVTVAADPAATVQHQGQESDDFWDVFLA